MAKDPICGMEVKEKGAITVSKDGSNYYFCSLGCRDKFIKEQGLDASSVCSVIPARPFYKNRLFLITSAVCLLLFFSYFLEFLLPFRRSFMLYFEKIWWAVLLGLLLGGVIDHFVPREYISKVLSLRRPRTILNAVVLGFLMSACSHGILALSIQLHKKGASNPAVISFLLASPWANFTVTVMIVGFFGAKGLLIILSALIVAVVTGLVFLNLEKRGLIEKNDNIVSVAEGFSIRRDVLRRAKEYRFSIKGLKSDIKGVLMGTLALSDMVLWWIVLGMLFASFAGAYIPGHLFHKYMGPTFMGMSVTLLLATVIEICSEGSSPLAFEIYRQTQALGNSFVFLMAGVATDYTEIGLIWSNLGKRTAICLILVSVPQVLLLGYLINLLH